MRKNRPIFTVRSLAFDATVRKSWNAELIELDETSATLVGAFDRGFEHDQLGRIAAGTVSYEYFAFAKNWNVFRMCEPDGTFRNYYFNICLPPSIRGRVLEYIDLDVDVVVWPDQRYEILDLEEFEVNREVLRYPTQVVAAARKALDEVIEMVEAGSMPLKDLELPRLNS